MRRFISRMPRTVAYCLVLAGIAIWVIIMSPPPSNPQTLPPSVSRTYVTISPPTPTFTVTVTVYPTASTVTATVSSQPQLSTFPSPTLTSTTSALPTQRPSTNPPPAQPSTLNPAHGQTGTCLARIDGGKWVRKPCHR